MDEFLFLVELLTDEFVLVAEADDRGLLELDLFGEMGQIQPGRTGLLTQFVHK